MPNSNSELYVLHAWEENPIYIKCVQGEGGIKIANFKLVDDSGAINLSSATSVTFDGIKRDGSGCCVTCNIVDAANGIVEFIEQTGVTDVSGNVKGTINVVFLDGNIKFDGITLYVAPNNTTKLIEASQAFSAFVEALNKLALITPEGTIAIDDVLTDEGVNAVQGKVIKAAIDKKLDNSKGSVKRENIEINAVGSDEIDSGAVETAKIADSAVTAGKLDSNAVTTQKIADSAVTANKLGSSAVTTGKINDGAVTNGKLADGAVTEGKIGSGAVTQDKIASSTYETTPTNGSSKLITSGGVYTFANGNFRKYKSITSSEVDDAIDQQTLYSVYYQGFFSVLYCVVGSTNRTQYLHKSTGEVLYRSQSLSDTWGDWNDWKYVASQNVYRKSSRPTTSSASKLWDICWYTDSSSVEHCYQLTSIGGTSENPVYNWTEIATSTSLANQVVVFSYILTSNGWNANNEQTVTKPSSYVVTSDVIADTEIDSTAYNQLCADGCGGIYISSERNGSTLTLTAHALNNKPTANVTIQVTLTKVSDLSE